MLSWKSLRSITLVRAPTFLVRPKDRSTLSIKATHEMYSINTSIMSDMLKYGVFCIIVRLGLNEVTDCIKEGRPR